jgi:predicted Zn-dependent protease
MATADRVCGDSTSLAALRSILERLTSTGEKPPYDFRMVVLRDTTVNAFAAPGGFIGVHSGLLAAAATPEEFAGVLSHEIQHVLLRHSTRAIVREVPLRLAVATITGGGVETAATMVTTLGALSYRRNDESEADREGMRMLQRARVDAAGAVAFMRTLEARREDAPRFVSYLMSHPRTAERVAQLEALAREQQDEPRPLLDSVTWAGVRRICSNDAPAPRPPR